MTYSSFSKSTKQLENKPAKLKKFLKHNSPKDRKFGVTTRKCKICGRIGAHLRKYTIGLCRQCFREQAKNLGFKKYS
ncbi:30S ribosomal protein S14 [archaeon]|nr:30S ribosomal protein S14 [archaeon]|tara:strand:+ start:921 stop:1151 length:231 start_codon:yes stop_codon:yes gene_type:complete